MSGHTPGPWRIERDDLDYIPKDVTSVEIESADGWVVAAIPLDFGDNEANARLIAAAPDLATFYHEFRDTARDVTREGSDAWKVLERIDAALSQAKPDEGGE